MTIFKKIVTDIYIVSWALFKVLIPTLIVVKIAEMAGAVYWLNVAMAPIVTMIGLPADMARISMMELAGSIIFASCSVQGR